MMHTDVSPSIVEVGPAETCTIQVHVTNASSMIDAYGVSVFGLDPSWVTVSPPRLSLFPDETGEVEVTIALPEGFPAGYRQLSVHVRSENDPHSFGLTALGLTTLGRARVSLRVDPVLVTAGTEASFGLVVTNEGNTAITAVPSVIDPEEKLAIEVIPAVVDLAPGQHEVVRATLSGDRPWFGQPKVRPITFAVDANTRVEALGTFLQKPRISRWLLSLMGLLAAAAVFAAVLSRTFDSVVQEAQVDPALMSQALEQGGAEGQSVPVQPAVLSGTVVLASTGEGVAGVLAVLFLADNVTVPVATAATAAGGTYSFGRLDTGTYKVRYGGAGFNEVWYESGLTAADALEIEVEAGKPKELNNVDLGGRPGTVKGTVEADDLTGITATLVVSGTVDPNTSAVVLRVDVSADGAFVFENVPSPASYQLVVQKAGYATETRNVEVGPAQTVDGIEMVLRRGDGTITGLIVTPEGPLGGANVEATDGTNDISTVSLTEGAVGSFTLRALTTPQTYTVTISLDGYSSETRTITLDTAEAADAGTIVLSRATGSISGLVSLQAGGPVGGVTVTAASGDTTVSTFTASAGDIGSYYISGLPVPATYTITFAKAGLVSQVRVQDLDPLANTADVSGIDVALLRDSAVIQGIVRGVDSAPVAGATLVLTNGTDTRTLVTANDPLGGFAFSGVEPGPYTLTASLPGSSPSVLLVNVTADEIRDLDIRLAAQASARGQVLLLNPASGLYEPYVGAVVRLFLPNTFPAAGTAVATTTTDNNGMYTFAALEAPQNYVVAVYQTPSSPDALDSQLILTQPSTQLTVPTFQIPVIF